MNLRILKYITLAAVLIAAAEYPVKGQEKESLSSSYFSTSLDKELNFSINSPIFSSSSFDKKIQWSDVGLYTHGQNGSLHRSQTGQSYYSAGFSSEGSFSDNRLFMTGKFNFSQEFKNQVRFTSHLNPYRGTPYDLADTVASDWRVQNYGVDGKVSYELVPGLLSIGLEGTIDVARGAKQIDPRPRTNNNNIEFTPSLSIHTNGHIFSIGGTCDLFRENMNMILYNSSEPQKLYEFKGLGQYTYSIFSTTSRDRKYSGKGLSGILSYQYSNNRFGIMLHGEYRNYGEVASEMENDKLKDLGKFFNDELDARLRLKFLSDKLINTLSLRYRQAAQTGREFFQVFDPSEDVNDWITESEFPRRWVKNEKSVKGKYGLHILSADRRYSILDLNLEARYASCDETYAVMDTYRRLETFSFQFSPEVNFLMGKKWFASAGLDGGYHRVPEFESAYKGREADDPIVKEDFFEHDSLILSSDWYKAGARVETGYALKNGSAFVLKLNYALYSAKDLVRHVFGASLYYNW